jgi:hypothetical protein
MKKVAAAPDIFYFLTVVQHILKTILIFENDEQLRYI